MSVQHEVAQGKLQDTALCPLPPRCDRMGMNSVGEAGPPAPLCGGGYLHAGSALFYLRARFPWISARVHEAVCARLYAFVNGRARVHACVKGKHTSFPTSLESGTR